MEYEIVFAPEARNNLLQLYDLIADRSGTARAQAYTERIISYCLGLATFPEPGATICVRVFASSVSADGSRSLSTSWAVGSRSTDSLRRP